MLDAGAAPCQSGNIPSVVRRADVPKFNESLLLRRVCDLEQLNLRGCKCLWVHAMVLQDSLDTGALGLGRF
jgi:hypothetical protein